MLTAFSGLGRAEVLAEPAIGTLLEQMASFRLADAATVLAD